MANKTEPAKFMTVSDILLQVSPALQGVMIRTIGRLSNDDFNMNLVWIQDHKTSLYRLVVDCSRITPFPFKDQDGLMYQFIGEVDCSKHNIVMIKALLYRCCEGLDMDTYIQAYTKRMELLQQS